MNSRRIIRYMFSEMLFPFLAGVLVFVAILLLFQALRLTEFVLIHGVKLETIGQIIAYLSISFLPAILPMSLLFAVLLTYSRFNSDSEIVAMKALGLHLGHIMSPALLLGGLVTFVSLETSFQLAPWGNRQFEVLISQLSQSKATVSIKEGTFSEGFFDLVIYTNEVEESTGLLKNLFIYDERNPQSPLTVIAKRGKIIQTEDPFRSSALLRLSNGNIHKLGNGTYTKVNFETYDIRLFSPVEHQLREKSSPSLTYNELRARIQSPHSRPEVLKEAKIELHKRMAIGFACFVFALTGVSLSLKRHQRHKKSGSLIMTIGVLVAFWALYIFFENLARNGQLDPGPAIWAPNMILALAASLKLYRARRQ